MKQLDDTIFSAAVSWEEYWAYAQVCAGTGQRPEKYHDEKMRRYTEANLARMKRVQEFLTVETKLYNLLSNLKESWHWLVLAEPWCGDAAQQVPALQILAACSPSVKFGMICSDAHPEIMAQFQTNGSNSIPKLVIADATGKVRATWGPRPAVLQMKVQEQIKDAATSFGDKVRAVHAWYEADNNKALQLELLDILKQL
ncbi:MAG: thioredoxin family protein [Chitinophagales bacterium]